LAGTFHCQKPDLSVAITKFAIAIRREGKALTSKLFRPLWIFYFLFVVKGILWAILIPPLEKPDEIHHVAYIQFVAKEERLPVQKKESWGGILDFEAHQPPLYYLLGAGVYRAIIGSGIQSTAIHDWANRANPNYIGRTQSSQAEPTFFIQNGTFFSPNPDFPYDIIGLRLYSVLMASIGVIAIYETCRLVWPKAGWPAVLATSLIIFIPQISFITASTTNDALAYTMGLLCILQMVRILRASNTQSLSRSYVLLGILLGLGLLTKLTLASLVLTAFVLPLLKARRSPGDLARAWIILLMGILLVSGGWFVRNWMLYEDLLGSHWSVNPEAFAWDLAPKSIFSDYFRLQNFWLWTGRSFVGKFGFMHLDMPGFLYPLYFALFWLGLLGSGIAFLRQTQGIDRRLLLLMLALMTTAVTQLIYLNLHVSQPQGRLLFHVSSALAIVLTNGLIVLAHSARKILSYGADRAGFRETIAHGHSTGTTLPLLAWICALTHALVNLYTLQDLVLIYMSAQK
jgi:4-amino-4-deoxy-L-arabinose transferase-like glycosyltransferase